MVDIESADSVASSAEDLERFAASMDSLRGTTGTAASLNSARCALGASFSVESADAAAAATDAVAVFREAIRSAGLADLGPTRVTVEQIAAAEAVSA
jgi:hypothetical protein